MNQKGAHPVDALLFLYADVWLVSIIALYLQVKLGVG